MWLMVFSIIMSAKVSTSLGTESYVGNVITANKVDNVEFPKILIILSQCMTINMYSYDYELVMQQ